MSSWRPSPSLWALLYPGRGLLCPTRLLYLFCLGVSVLLLLWVSYGPSQRSLHEQDMTFKEPRHSENGVQTKAPARAGVAPVPCSSFPRAESDVLAQVRCDSWRPSGIVGCFLRRCLVPVLSLAAHACSCESMAIAPRARQASVNSHSQA